MRTATGLATTLKLDPLPRPGMRLGAYPQRKAPTAPWNWFEAEVWRARWQAPRAPSQQARQAFLQQVRTKRALFTSCDANFLLARARRLRPLLAVAGLHTELTSELFAMVDASFHLHRGIHLHDTQLLAAWLMLERRLVEIQTGEGKTYSVALAAAAAALAGTPVHLVTANDYLAARDAALLAPVFASIGLTTGTVVGQTPIEARAQQYRCDITYCTAREVTFDFLRDRLRFGDQPEADAPTLLRGLCMAILDEADSVLIDEARLPAVLSGAAPGAEQAAFYRQAIFLAAQFKQPQHYVVNRTLRSAVLTDNGREHAKRLARHMGGVWENRRWREETLTQALAALHVYQKDRHYLIRERKVVIIDETTGRAAEGRVWSRGLHQLIEIKENCDLSLANRTLAQTTFQEVFSRYLRLSGVSGTLVEARKELLTIYQLPVVKLAPRLPCQRRIEPARVVPDKAAQWAYVAARVRTLQQAGRAVLIGTDSVEDSEELSQLLSAANVTHQVLNARQDAEEAQVVAQAGCTGMVTVSTNMAGRGTDVALDAQVLASGGLHVIVCQTNDSLRVDRQLYGRSARQGQPGSVEPIYRLDQSFVPFTGWVQRLARIVPAKPDATLPGWLASAARLTQRWRAHYRQRESWYAYLQEHRRKKQMSFTGR